MCVRVAIEALGRVDLLDRARGNRHRRGQLQEGPLPDRSANTSPAGWSGRRRAARKTSSGRQEELRDIAALPLLAARRALDEWLAYAFRSELAPVVRFARTIRAYRTSEATNEWRLANRIS